MDFYSLISNIYINTVCPHLTLLIRFLGNATFSEMSFMKKVLKQYFVKINMVILSHQYN